MLLELLEPSTMSPAPEAQTAEDLSVIIPVPGDEVNLEAAYQSYKDALAGVAARIEFIYVLARGNQKALATLARLKEAGEPLLVVVLSRWDDEATALRSALRQAMGHVVITLPAWCQVGPAELAALLAALADCDMVVARREEHGGRHGEGLQSSLFHWLVRRLFGQEFGDLSCRVRVYRRQVLDEIVGYGTAPHFLPLLAAERGFRVREVEVRGSRGEQAGVFGGFSLRSRLRLVLDSLGLYVVLKFTRKPLRFFGAIGLPILGVGLIYTGALGVARLFFGVGLADRPALILGVLLVVLGIQVIALGLIGEIIIFASGKRIKDYTIERIL